MFKKLIEQLRKLTKGQDPIDPSQFNDPVASQTEWTPAKRGGANFCTHKLATINFERIEFRASAGAVVFYSIFLLIGLGIMIGVLFFALSSGKLSLKVGIDDPVFQCRSVLELQNPRPESIRRGR